MEKDLHEIFPAGEVPSGEGIEELRYGRFSPAPERIRQIRREAKARGEDPDKAEEEYRLKMKEATRRLHLREGERARRQLQRYLERKSRPTTDE